MSSRFAVSDVQGEGPSENGSAQDEVTANGSGQNASLQARARAPGSPAPVVPPDSSKTKTEPPKMDYLAVDNADRNQLTVTSVTSGNLALYEEELQSRPRIAQLLSSLVPVDGVMAPNMSASKKGKKKKKANLGTIMGVYLPTVQNILGVILFLRLPWIVGVAGVGMAFFLVALCCIATFLTAISLSAIATNGHVPGGGAYFMISRNLGPEFGGAVGVLFYLANTFASSLYVVGAVEILVTYIVPQASLFGEVSGANPDVLNNNIRVYGTILLLLLSLIVFVGVKIVNWFATGCLIAVIIAVVSIYAGALNPTPRLSVCTINETVLRGPLNCDPDVVDNATQLLLQNQSMTSVCTPLNPELRSAFEGVYYFPDSESDEPDAGWVDPPTCLTAIPAITRTVTIVENTAIYYLDEGEVRPGEGPASKSSPQVTATLATSFLVLIGIFFPSVTGIMAGSNRSGDLKDAQKSIPIGTLAAISTTSTIYLTCVLFFGGTIRRFLLVDQFGEAAGLTVALLAWPTRWIILIGALFSTLGAGLQSLTGAPRLMQAIANDNLLSFLNFFKRTGLNGEPSFALVLTVCLSEIGVLIASLDLVAPILTMFFLICYMFVNFACVLQSILKAPNWRPRFKYYHWVTSLIGALLCLILMFLVSWYYALVALILAALIYKYIEYRGAEKEWGDGVHGLSLQAARYALLKLEEGPLHTKNWRPQILLLCRLDVNLLPSQPKILSFASQLKAGKGLMMVYSVLEGHYTSLAAECIAAKQSLKRFCDDYKIEGFVQTVAAPNVMGGLTCAIQSAGLGGMRHNTLVICWPDGWRKKESWKLFIDCIRVASRKELAVLVPKGVNWFPSNEDRMKGNIDIWWVVHDGGLLMLLPFLLRQHKVWKHCHLRIFTVAQMEDNSIQMKKDLAAFLYQLRIPAEVDVIEMPDTSISAYTYERTLVMEQRNEFLKQMKMTERQKKGDVQHLLARSFSRKSIPTLPTPTSPSAEISFPVPQLPTRAKQKSSTPPPPTITEADETVSIGELSEEPRVLGGENSRATGTELIDLSSPLLLSSLPVDVYPQERAPLDPAVVTVGTNSATANRLSSGSMPTEDTAPWRTTPTQSAGKGTPPRREHRDSDSSSDDSCPEEQSVRTPLLDGEAPATLPVNIQPSIKHYDDMFNVTSGEPVGKTDDEIPLGGTAETLNSQPNEENLQRMNTSVKLNELIVTHSHDAALVIVNLPGPPANTASEQNYMEFLDVLTEGLERVLMVRGGGREVITIYS